jgi:hypothetical protein
LQPHQASSLALTACAPTVFGNSFYSSAKTRKSYRNRIVLNKFFATNFLFAIDRRVQHWLRSCKHAYHSRAEVKNCVLQYDNIINKVLNGTFQMILSPTFKKVQDTISLAEIKNDEAKRGNEAKTGLGKEGNK